MGNTPGTTAGDPTPTQARLLRHLYDALARGEAPTLRELAAAFGWSSPTAPLSHLRALERLGLLLPGSRRGHGLNPRIAGVRLVPAFEQTPEGERARRILEGEP